MRGIRGRGGAWAPWGASVRFAERVAERHGRVTSVRGGVGRVTLRAARGLGRVAARREGRLRLELRVRVEGGGVGGTGLRRKVGAGGPPPLATYARAGKRPPSIHRAAEQVFAHPDRIDRVVAGRRPSPSASAAPYPRAFPPVPRVVCRGTPHDAPAATDPRDLTFHRPDRAPAPRRALLGTQASPLAALDQPELARLTSQVVDAIDRRLAAYRERHGRV